MHHDAVRLNKFACRTEQLVALCLQVNFMWFVHLVEARYKREISKLPLVKEKKTPASTKNKATKKLQPITLKHLCTHLSGRRVTNFSPPLSQERLAILEDPKFRPEYVLLGQYQGKARAVAHAILLVHNGMNPIPPMKSLTKNADSATAAFTCSPVS